jgi:hypothetical protein
MQFHHPEIDQLNPRTSDGLRLLLEHLCGEKVEIGCRQPKEKLSCGECQSCMNWTVLSERLKLESLRLEDLNDILILVDQFPISQPFFELFLSAGKSEITFEELKAGVTKFEGYAVLLFGNVRFAYRRLRRLPKALLQKEMQGLDRLGSKIIEEDFEPRRKSLPLPAEVNSKSTWLLGYIEKNKADREITMYAANGCRAWSRKGRNFFRGKE